MIDLKLKPRFFLISVALALLWGLVILPYLVTWMDNTDAIIPPVASLIYYTGIFLSFGVLLYSVLEIENSVKFTKFAIILALLYISLDFFEPPTILTTSGTIEHALGYKASLDYSVAWTLHELFGFEWSSLYYIVNVGVPVLCALLIVIIASPQLLGKALRR